MRHSPRLPKIIFIVYGIVTAFVLFVTTINCVVYVQSKNFIVSSAKVSSTLNEKKEYAIVLGASVHGERLSQALESRVVAAIDLYQKGLVQKILMSGDGLQKNYNETLAMKKFAIKHGIPDNVIETDDRGLNTYASVLRAKNVYHITNAYIISQEFHIGRAVWIARHMGMPMIGVSVGGFKVFDYYTFREIFARFKDFFQVWIGNLYGHALFSKN